MSRPVRPFAGHPFHGPKSPWTRRKSPLSPGRRWMLFLVSLLLPGGLMATPVKWVLRPEVSEVLAGALQDGTVQELLASRWRVESLSVGSDRIEVRLLRNSGECAVATLFPSGPERASPEPIAWRPCQDQTKAPSLDQQTTAFLDALQRRISPGDWSPVVPADADRSSDRVLSRGSVALLLGSAGVQFLWLVALALWTLWTLVAAPAPRRDEGPMPRNDPKEH